MFTQDHVLRAMCPLFRFITTVILLVLSFVLILADTVSSIDAAKSGSAAKLKYFGYDFFSGSPTSFTVAPDTTVPADYLLDANDVLRVRYWTPTIAETSHELTVNQAGTVAVPGIGDVKAAHLTIDGFRENLGQRLREQLKNPSFSADLLTPRTISVYVVGSAQHPGRYTVRADANLFNVIFAAGGPSEEGSMRKIALKRHDQLVTEIDAYKFLLNGSPGKETRLEDQDIIFFPTAGTRVTISGEAARPGVYETLGEMKISDALSMAGGLTASAHSRVLRLQRIENGERVEKTLDAQAILADAKHADNIFLLDGDILSVENVSSDILGKVTIKGTVSYPGNYSLTRTPTAKKLIEEAKVKIGAYWERADLQRNLPDGTPIVIAIPLKQLLDGKAEDVPLTDLDEIVVYSNDEKVITPLVAVEGAVKHPAKYRYSDGMRLGDLLFVAGGLLHDASVDVAHLYRRVGPGEYKILRVSPTLALNGNADDNPALQDEDRLVIYNQQDLDYKKEKVSILGEVQHPGEYQVYQGLTLFDLLLQAGGPTDMTAGTVEVASSALDSNGMSRTDVKVHPLSEVIGGTHRDDPITAGMMISLPRQGGKLAQPRQVELRGKFKRPGFYALFSDEETLSSVIERAGGFTDDSDPFGLSLSRTKENMLSKASALQVKTILDAMDQLLPGIDKTPGQTTNNAQVMDVDTPSLAALSTASSRTEKIVLVSPRRLNGMPTSSRIGFNMEDRDSYIERLGKVRLADGDVIEVPGKSQVVQVLGAVQSAGPVFYQKAYSAKDFISRAGGASPDADMKRAVIVKVSGTVQPLAGAKYIDAGDVIVVPSKYQVVQPPTHRRLEDTLLNIIGVALVIRGLQ